MNLKYCYKQVKYHNPFTIKTDIVLLIDKSDNNKLTSTTKRRFVNKLRSWT